MEENSTLEQPSATFSRWMVSSGVLALVALTLTWFAAGHAHPNVLRLNDNNPPAVAQLACTASQETTCAIPEPSGAPVQRFIESPVPPTPPVVEGRGITVAERENTPKGNHPPGVHDVAAPSKVRVHASQAAVDLSRLAEEYKALLTKGSRSDRDLQQMASAEREMASLVGGDGRVAEAALALLARESDPSMAKYLGRLLRHARGEETRLAVETIACTDPLAARRAGAIAAIGPVLDSASSPLLDRTLADPDRSVRLDAARAIVDAAALEATRIANPPLDWLANRMRSEEDAEVRSTLAHGLELLRQLTPNR